MGKGVEIQIIDIVFEKTKHECRAPMKIGSRTVSDITIGRAIVTVEAIPGKKKAAGIGEATFGLETNWPSKTLTPDQMVRILVALAERIAQRASILKIIDHPISFGLRLMDEAKELATQLAEQMKLTEPIPETAVMLACSAIDAAIHDAFARVHERNCFEVLSAEWLPNDLSVWLGDDFAGKSLDQFILPKPKTTIPLYHLVGILDPLSEGEIIRRANDGFPETLGEWIKTEGVTHIKIRLQGNDLDWDVGRVIEVDRIANAAEQQTREWRFAIDFAEQAPNEDYVLDLLERIDRLSKSGLARIQYVEQPIPRDLAARKEITMHRVGRIKPVVIDESLVDIASFRLARQQGYSGIALKPSKTQTHCLLLGAAAQHYGMFTSVQDLTSVGSAFLQTASLAARFANASSVEGSGRQYCPSANAAWEEIYKPLFRIRGGIVPTELLDGPGLGFRWPKKLLPRKHAQLAATQ